MCEPTKAGILPGFPIGRGQGQQPAQPCKCEQPQRDTPTQTAQKTLAVVGGIVLLACMHAILHGLLIVVVSVLAVAVLTGGWLLARRVRSIQRQYKVMLPAPLLDAPPRTQVRSVSVQAIEPGRPRARTTSLPEVRQARARQ